MRESTEFTAACSQTKVIELHLQVEFRARYWKQIASEKVNHVTVHYTGAEEKDFYGWIGSDLDYQEQPAGDLGQRMRTAFARAFKGGIEQVIGMNNFHPELFSEIDWGTERVYGQTRKRATRLGLQIAELPVLNDIDRPEDLDVLKEDPWFREIIGKERNP